MTIKTAENKLSTEDSRFIQAIMSFNLPAPKDGDIRVIPPADSFEAAHNENWSVQKYNANDNEWCTLEGKKRTKALKDYHKKNSRI